MSVMDDELLRIALADTLSERTLSIPSDEHRFSLRYRLKRRSMCRCTEKAPKVSLRRMPRAILVLILIAAIALTACTAVSVIRRMIRTDYDGYSVLAPNSYGERSCVTDFYWLPKSTGCKYIGRQLFYDKSEIYQVISNYDCCGMTLTLTQSIPNAYNIINTRYSELVSDRNGIYMHQMGDVQICYWEQDGYIFTLSMQGKEKIERYIHSIEVFL